MSNLKYKTKVSLERWKQAQTWENSVWQNWPVDADDWNVYWANQFDNYSFLNAYNINSILEVGCGPWAQNTRHVLKVVGQNKDVYLEDPLINNYLQQGKFIKNLKATYISQPLEDLSINKKFDLIICINVLDHVRDIDMCFESIYKHMNNNSLLIFGQDLSDETDIATYPIEDVGHPIRINLDICEKLLNRTESVFKKIVPRNEGRNPGAHCGLIIYCGKFLG